jgi:hypothetical protein
MCCDWKFCCVYFFHFFFVKERENQVKNEVLSDEEKVRELFSQQEKHMQELEKCGLIEKKVYFIISFLL